MNKEVDVKGCYTVSDSLGLFIELSTSELQGRVTEVSGDSTKVRRCQSIKFTKRDRMFLVWNRKKVYLDEVCKLPKDYVL